MKCLISVTLTYYFVRSTEDSLHEIDMNRGALGPQLPNITNYTHSFALSIHFVLEKRSHRLKRPSELEREKKCPLILQTCFSFGSSSSDVLRNSIPLLDKGILYYCSLILS